MQETDKRAQDTLRLVPGRPADRTGRLERELRVYDFLDAAGVTYERIDHEAVATMEEGRAVEEALRATVCKNLLLCDRHETEFYLLMLVGEKKYRAGKLAAQLGISRLSFADPRYMEEFLDLSPGAVSVMGLMNDRGHRVRLLMDREVLGGEFFACHPCVNTSSIRLRTADLMEKILPALGYEPILIDAG